MTNFRPLIVLGAATLLLAACQAPAPSITAGDPSASDFNQALASGYTDLAASERSEQDWRDGDHFEAKAGAALGGGVGPDNPAERELTSDMVQPLSDGHIRLLYVLNMGAHQSNPGVAAAAQVNYDCWLQEQEENHQEDQIAACREAFEAAMAQLEPAVMVIYFDLDSDVISPEAASVLDVVAARGRTAMPARLLVRGHTDRSGSDGYNLALSARRADSTVAYLSAQGVTAEIVEENLGERAPAVRTADGVAHPSNRRVEIHFIN